MEDISPLVMPSQSQQSLWWRYIMADDGVDQDGYWLGHCPIHDHQRDPEVASAQFNFRKGVLRCLGDPCCHKGRAMSLTNVTLKLMEESGGQR